MLAMLAFTFLAARTIPIRLRLMTTRNTGIKISITRASRHWMVNMTAIAHDLIPESRYQAFFAVVVVMVAAYLLRSALQYVVSYWGHTFGVLVEGGGGGGAPPPRPPPPGCGVDIVLEPVSRPSSSCGSRSGQPPHLSGTARSGAPTSP